jgi:hypothetical protein
MKKRLYFLLMMLLMCFASVQLNAQQRVAFNNTRLPETAIDQNKVPGTPVTPKISTTNKVVGYWKMDDGAGTVVSDELGISDGTIINPGDNIWVDGYIGKALDITSRGALDTSVFVQIPGDSVDFPSSKSFSFSAIVKLDISSGAEQSIVSKGMPFVDNGGWYHLSYKAGAARFMVWDKTTLTSPEGVFPKYFPKNDWVHVVCVRNVEEDSLKVYLNGVELDACKDITDGEISNDGDLFIGTVPNFKTDCRGAIDEVKIYEGALTDQEIKDLAESYGFNPISNVAGYWKMDEGTGTTVKDELGKSDGTIINPGDNVWVDGYIGKAVDISSKGALDTSVFVHIPGAKLDFDSTQSFSFSTIVKLDVSNGAEQSIVSKGMPFVDNGGWYHLSFKAGAARFMVWDTKTLTSPDGVFPKYFPTNDWVHVVCVRNVEQDSLKVYLNGIELDACKDLTNGNISNDGDLYIGTVPNFKTDCRGAIDEVKIFKGALTNEEIKDMAESYGFAPISNLAGYWKMDEGTGTTVKDELGLSDGTIINPGDNIWVDGYIGKALDITSKGALDTSVFVMIPGANVDFDSTESFSFSAIVKLDVSSGAEQSIVSKGMPFVDNGGWYHLSFKAGAARFMVWDKTTLTSPEGVFPKFFPKKNWVNVVCVRNVEQDSLKVYLNGVKLDACKDLTNGNIATDGNLYIGTVPNFKTDCRGAIDEVKIFKGALTDEEIKNLADAYGFAPISNLAGYWKMDEGSGTWVKDEIGLSHGTLVNPGENIWVDGYIGKALDFTSKGALDTSVFVSIPGDNVDFDSTKSFSFSVIAKLDITDGAEQSLISKGMPFVDNGGWYHLSYKAGAARFMVWDKTTLTSPDGVFPESFPTNDWVNFVCVRNVEEDSLKVYLNGVELDACKDLTNGNIATDGNLYIGTVPNFKTDCRGAIDEVKIFREALSEEAIRELAEAYGFQPIVTAVGSIEIENAVSVYPNPVARKLHITNAANSVISIYSLNGAFVKTINSTAKDVEIDVTDLNSGVYILKIRSDNNVAVSKFMKE